MKARWAVACFVLGVVAFGLAQVVGAQGGSLGWVRVGSPGLGDPNNELVACLAPFNNQLYAGAGKDGATGQIWRKGTDLTWTAVMTTGFGVANNNYVYYLAAFNGQLYAGTGNPTDGCEIWRSNNGTNWNRVVTRGFGDTTNGEIARLFAFGGKLYATTMNYASDRGLQIWRSSSGSLNDWSKVVPNGFGDINNKGAWASELFNGYLYVGASSYVASGGSTGGEVWRTNNGTAWTQVNADGFGTRDNIEVSALAAFNGYLYASTSGSVGHGAEVWRCQTCSSAGDWTKVADNGFGKADTKGMGALEVYQAYLYCAVGNRATGMEVWRSSDGTHWEQAGFVGFDSQYNWAPYRDSSVALFNNYLYVGTWHPGTGGEVWMYLPNRVYLPVLRRTWQSPA